MVVEKDVEKGAPAAAEAAATAVAAADSNVVDWDGPDDPANPRNWSHTYKLINVWLISLSVLYCNLATTMFSPGANLMQQEFGFKNHTVKILTITIASLGFALGQLFIPPLSEVFGRVPIYRASAIFYMGFTAGCSRSINVVEFLIFRLCTGMSAASYMSTGGGTVAELLRKEERGVAMAIFTAGPLLGPVCCPVVEKCRATELLMRILGCWSYRRRVRYARSELEMDLLSYPYACEHCPSSSLSRS